MPFVFIGSEEHLTAVRVRFEEGTVGGYHKREIKKGVLGESSKIREELDELEDAEDQENKILVHCELADLYGALRACAREYWLTMEDLVTMADATERAFQSGERK
jgi:hypothetical protein